MKMHIMVFALIMAIMGCSSSPAPEEVTVEPPLPLPVIEEAVKWARENFDAVEELPVQELYAHDFEKARDELARAESFLQDELYDEAYSSALESLGASQRILRQFYQDSIVQSAEQTKFQIEAIIAEDPDDPLNEFLLELHAILDYSDQIGTGQQDIDGKKVLADLEKVHQIQQTAQTTVKQTLETDVSFEPGKYELSEEGKNILKLFAEEILASQKEFSELFPDSTIHTNIKVMGYTDQVDFNEDTNFVQSLIEGIGNDIPRTQPARRKFFNQRLSEFRARTVSEYIVQILEQENSPAHIEQKILGLGEELPPGIPPTKPHAISDPQRRICRIYGYIVAQ